MAWSRGGRYIATGGHDDTVRIWDAASQPGTRTIAASHPVTWSTSGGLLAFAREGEVRVVATATGEEIVTLECGDGMKIRSLASHPDDRLLAAALGDGTVRVWELAGGQEVFSVVAHFLQRHPGVDLLGDKAQSVAWSPDGRLLASAGLGRRKVKIWDVAEQLEVTALDGHTASVGSVAWSPDGRRLATASWDQVVKVWDVTTWEEVHHLLRHSADSDFGSDGGSSLAWSPSGDRLAAGSSEGLLVIWDVATGQEILRKQSHPLNVRSVSWSPDGRRIATGSGDRTAKIWDAVTGQELLTLRGHDGGVSTVAWSPDSLRLATADSASVKLWEAPGYESRAKEQAFEAPTKSNAIDR